MSTEQELKGIILDGENILYQGRPDKKCFIFESIFNPLLPFAILWGIIDFSIIGGVVLTDSEGLGNMFAFIILFFALHLMPVWIYLGGVLMSTKRYRNTYYVITDQAIYISGGIMNRSINRKPFMELSRINLHRGIFDQMFGVGDIILTSDQRESNGAVSTGNINSISNYNEVYKIVSKLQKDIYTDVMYPNDKRPKENHGYNTDYKGL